MKKVITLCALALPSLAMAQQPDSVHRLEEVVVSTTRYEKPAAVSKIEAPLKEIPITVNSISSKEIEVKGYTDVAEALREVPGVHAYRQYGAFHMFYVRGFYESLLINDAMRDERHAIWQSAPITGLGSVERIEVLKGAASMQQGHSAVGGVINVVRKAVSAKTGAYARLSAGSYDTYRLSAGGTGALTSRLLVRADAEAVKSSGWRDNYTKGYNLSLVAKYLISSRSNIQLSLYGNSDNYGGDYGIPRYANDAFKASDNSLFAKAGTQDPHLKRTDVHGFSQDDLGHKNLSAQLKYELRLGKDWKLTEQAFVSWDDIKYMSTDGYGWATQDTPDADHPYYFLKKDDLGNEYKAYTDLNTLERWGFAFDYETRSLQNQLELAGKVYTGELKHNLLFGYNYLNMDMVRYDAASYDGAGYSNPITLINPKRHQGDMTWKFGRQQKFADQTHGLYVQDYAKWGKLAVLAGLRLDYFMRDFTVSDSDGKKPTKSHGTQSIRNLALTYRAGLVYSPTEDINLYVSASNFYKPQKVALSSEVVYLDDQGNEMGAKELSKLPPITGHQIEVGSHLAFGKKLSVDASLFYLTLKNKLNSYLGTNAAGKNIGALVDGYISKGVELDVNYRPIEMLGLRLGYGFTDARVMASEGANAKYISNPGKFVEHTPMHKLSLWASYLQRLGKHSSLNYGVGTETASKFYTSESNEYSMPGYTILNAVVGYQWKRWSLQLNANNILDADYTRHVLYDVQYLPSEGRNFLLSLGFKL